jgi:hypothetical protein
LVGRLGNDEHRVQFSVAHVGALAQGDLVDVHCLHVRQKWMCVRKRLCRVLPRRQRVKRQLVVAGREALVGLTVPTMSLCPTAVEFVRRFRTMNWVNAPSSIIVTIRQSVVRSCLYEKLTEMQPGQVAIIVLVLFALLFTNSSGCSTSLNSSAISSKTT